MTRDEHLQWCKDRAVEYVDRGELSMALASFTSDVRKHEDTADLAENLLLQMEGYRCVDQRDREGMRHLIVGFR